MTAITLFASTFALVFFLGLQSLVVNAGHRWLAFANSFAIGTANLVLFKLAPDALAERIRRFQFRDIRPKAASELPVEHASRLLGHSEKEITERVYRRIGEVVKPTK